MTAGQDFRSDRMESPEGRGIARRAWEAYSRNVQRAAEPAVRRVAAPIGVDLVGFWLTWHLEGGFQGLLRLGMSRASIYRRVSRFRKITGQHPDEWQMPGVTVDVKAYLEADRVIAKIIG